MKEAYLYEKQSEGKVRCFLCSHRCLIADGKRGVCCVRENKAGILYTLVYEKLISANVDPIEKKPFFHFLPGSKAFSVAAPGCNFRCLHCQNHEISQLPRDKESIVGEKVSAEEIVSMALKYNCASISYTYTEPTIFFEYAYDTAAIARQKGIKNNFVTNGYMTAEALDMIAPNLDGANVDLKSFSEEFYKKICGAQLKPVLESITRMHDLGIWVEVTTLIIPTLNDAEDELREIARFLFSVSPEIPWHVSAFYPTYRLLDKPPTSPEIIRRAREIGLEEGLRYVYSGNIPGDEGENTSCYHCKKVLLKRRGYQVAENSITEGKCSHCGTPIEGVWH
ncbi:MAG: AmmeMemoRadiSam system radical SAM enzyme [Deltaproteobacteria bacterium RBG_16_54_11]|jgi:pyruvate formate lyase activating enzyme|nr:MAG: AmmeMemoRadiSam system radical SAM enzyme [Deltaproteobacteria bacterium RBG_16_54_11]